RFAGVLLSISGRHSNYAWRSPQPGAGAMSSDWPDFPETPSRALGPPVRETVLIDEFRFLIERPRELERIVHCQTGDEYLPFWADLWPASRMLAKAILREPLSEGRSALELGCGLGLPGVAALARGLHVIFSDFDRTALRFAGHNA